MTVAVSVYFAVLIVLVVLIRQDMNACLVMLCIIWPLVVVALLFAALVSAGKDE